jgi:hypothetical protein
VGQNQVVSRSLGGLGVVQTRSAVARKEPDGEEWESSRLPRNELYEAQHEMAAAAKVG